MENMYTQTKNAPEFINKQMDKKTDSIFFMFPPKKDELMVHLALLFYRRSSDRCDDASYS